MYFEPADFLKTLPLELQKLIEDNYSKPNRFTGKTSNPVKAVLVITDGIYTESFSFGVDRNEANTMIDLGKSNILSGNFGFHKTNVVLD